MGTNTINPQEDKDLIIISRDIDFPLFFDISEVIKNRKTKANKNCVLFLTTPGGDPNAGYRIAKCLQNTYDNIRLVVSSYCKSAGTLIAISANEIAFGDLGELGPLDVQVMKQDEFGAQASGLDIIEAMEAISNHMRKSFAENLVNIRLGTKISTRLAGDLAAQITASIAAPLYAQIDPQRVAEMQRAMSIALKYGERLANKPKSLLPHALEKLVTDYPTHSFVIDKDEASELFHKVVSWSPCEEHFYDEYKHIIAFPKRGKEGGPFLESYNKLMTENEHKKNNDRIEETSVATQSTEKPSSNDSVCESSKNNDPNNVVSSARPKTRSNRKAISTPQLKN